MSSAPFDKPLDQWSTDELGDELTERYGPVTIPPCRVCGGELGLGKSGGGYPNEWACPNTTVDGRTDWKHYEGSIFVDRRAGGDNGVMEALRRLGLATARVTELEAQVATLVHEVGKDMADALGLKADGTCACSHSRDEHVTFATRGDHAGPCRACPCIAYRTTEQKP